MLTIDFAISWPSGVCAPTKGITIAMPFSNADTACNPFAAKPRFWVGAVAGEEPIGG